MSNHSEEQQRRNAPPLAEPEGRVRAPHRPAGRLSEETADTSADTATEANYGIDRYALDVPLSDPARDEAVVPERIGKVRLDVIRLSLTARDARIIRSLAEHQFLSTRDIERWHFADHASPLTAARTCRRTLARLRELGVLGAIGRRRGGFHAGSSQHVWFLTPAGARIGSGRRTREPSTAFVEHLLGVARVHLDLIDAERAGRLSTTDFSCEPQCWRTFPGSGGQVVTLKPDFFAVVSAGGDYESLVFGEYDRGTESLKTIVKKAGVYEAYWRTGLEERRSGAFPKVLWIAPDESRLARIRAALGKTARVTLALHDFTTPGGVVDAVASPDEEASS